MKKIWKPLASFFASNSKEEESDEEEKNLNAGEETDADSDEEETDEDSEGDSEEENSEEEESGTKKEAKISLSATRYTELMEAENRLVKVQAELEKFGKNPEDRAQMIKDSKQLQTWYENQKNAGAAPEEDAGKSQGKAKRKSSVTAEAEAIENKRK